MSTRNVLRALAAFGVIGFTSCGAERQASGDASADSPREVPVDIRAEEQAIRAQEQRWRDVMAKRDTAAIGRFYAADGIYAPQGSAAYRGRRAVVDRWAGEFAAGFVLERSPIRIVVAKSGDVATEVGTYTVRLTADGKPRQAGGTYMTAWQKVGDEWQIASYMWNRDAVDPPSI